MITPETDLIEQADGFLNKNTMILDMSTNGTKNYNIRLSTRNTEWDNAGWIIGQAQFNGILIFHLEKLGYNIAVEPGDYYDQSILGDYTLAVRVVYIHKDINDLNRKIERTRFTRGEILNYMKAKMIEEMKNNNDKDENGKNEKEPGETPVIMRDSIENDLEEGNSEALNNTI
jgi:hypothetical protein